MAASLRSACSVPTTSARSSRRAVVVRAEAVKAPFKTYFIASNVFKVKPESSNDFEEVWRTRESHLKEMPGFVRFAMLKCTNVPGKYISQTTWESEEAFKNWTQSQQFKASHGSKEDNTNKRPPVMTMLEGPPNFEGFVTVTTTEI